MTMHRPTLVALASALLLGCPQSSSSDGTATADDSGTGETSGSTSNPMTESLSNSASNSETETDPTTETTLTTDPDSSSTEPPGTESSTGDEECNGKDECIMDDDCAPGQTCVGCLCFGEPMGCADYGEGVFGDCLNDDGTVNNAACMADGAGCVVDDVATPTAGVCFFDCEEPCDCPQPPKGFESQVACELLTDDVQTQCFLDCSGGGDCPEDMYCLANFLCVFGDAPMGIPDYGDCVNLEGACDGGICLTSPDSDWGFCAGGCMDDADCPAPAQGDSEQSCIDYSGEGDMACALFCEPDTVCPDGMYCETDFGICAWDVGEPWSNCVADPPEACPPDFTCVTNEVGVNGICGGPCDDVMDCDAAPATGTAVLTCGDVGAGNICHLSCAMGETCPDGTACIDDLFCAYEVQ